MILTKDSYFLFSGGEVHGHYSQADPEIILLDYTMNGLMALAQAQQIIKDRCATPYFNVTIPYLPYARQDRWMADDEPFSLKLYCNFLNSLNLQRVTIYDPHSDVAPALINNCNVIPQWEIAKLALPKEFFKNRNVLFVSSDAGAYKKLYKLMPDDTRIVIGTKTRDVSGKIISTNVFSQTTIQGHECVIVDDICDGGRTFIELAKVLKEKGATKIYLYVTHGIFSQGLEVLKDLFDTIYTTNSFTHPEQEFLKVTKIV